MTPLKGSCPLGPTEERGSKDPVIHLCIGNFYNMVLTSVEGQSPQVTTFPHFFPKMTLGYIQSINMTKSGNIRPVYTLR